MQSEHTEGPTQGANVRSLGALIVALLGVTGCDGALDAGPYRGGPRLADGGGRATDAGLVARDAGPTFPDAATDPLRTELDGDADLEVACVARATTERLLDADPEGRAWIATATGLAVIDASGTRTAISARPVAAVDSLVAFGAGEAVWVADGVVEHLSSAGLRRVWLPSEVRPVAVCGTSTGEGGFFVASATGLYRRNGASFERMRVGATDLVVDGLLARASGECFGASGNVWFSDATGTTYALTSGSPIEVRSLEGDRGGLAWQPVASGDEEVFVVRDGDLAVVADDFRGVVHTIRFVDGPVRAVSAAASRVWVRIGGRLAVREADGRFRGVASPSMVGLVAEGPFADATGGAWLTTETSFCHARPRHRFTIEGLRPDMRVIDAPTLRVAAAATIDAVEVLVDGHSVHRAAPAATEASVPLTVEPGWHDVAVRVSTEGESLERHVGFELVDTMPPSFAADIAPLLTARCSGASCHGSTYAPALHDYASFEQRAVRAVARMTDGQMPPPGDAGRIVDEELIHLVERWLRGGKRP